MRYLPSWSWLVLAGVFGITASLAWFRSQATQPTPRQEKSVAALVAKRDIAPATRISADQVQLAPWFQESLPKGAFADATALQGRVASLPMIEGELILEKKLAPKGTGPGLTALLPANMRAMTIKVDEASGVAGFVVPENRVDVLVTVDKGDYSNNPLSKVLLQNLRVLGTGQRLENRPGDKPQVVPTVTLEVSPAAGERLALAAQEGRISLVLRGQEDDKVLVTQGVQAKSLFVTTENSRKTDTGRKPATVPRRIVEVIRGLQRDPVSF